MLKRRHVYRFQHNGHFGSGGSHGSSHGSSSSSGSLSGFSGGGSGPSGLPSLAGGSHVKLNPDPLPDEYWSLKGRKGGLSGGVAGLGKSSKDQNGNGITTLSMYYSRGFGRDSIGGHEPPAAGRVHKAATYANMATGTAAVASGIETSGTHQDLAVQNSDSDHDHDHPHHHHHHHFHLPNFGKRADYWKLFVMDVKPRSWLKSRGHQATPSVASPGRRGSGSSSSISRTKSLPFINKSHHDLKLSFKRSKDHHKDYKHKSSAAAAYPKHSPLEHRNKAMKKKLHEYGSSPLEMLLHYLHNDEKVPLVSPMQFDEDELRLARSLDHAVDLDRYFAEVRGTGPTPATGGSGSSHPSSKAKVGTNQKIGISTALRPQKVTVESGPAVSSLKKKLPPPGWEDIERLADAAYRAIMATHKQRPRMASTASRQKSSKLRSLLFTPHPDLGWDRVWQAGHTLPHRRWTSELFLETVESAALLSGETRSNLKWNASLEDVRHLISTGTSSAAFDRRLRTTSLATAIDQIDGLPTENEIRFRRFSFGNHVWRTGMLNERKRSDYYSRLSTAAAAGPRPPILCTGSVEVLLEPPTMAGGHHQNGHIGDTMSEYYYCSSQTDLQELGKRDSSEDGIVFTALSNDADHGQKTAEDSEPPLLPPPPAATGRSTQRKRSSRSKRFTCEPACLDTLCIDGERADRIAQEITWTVRDLLISVNPCEIVRLLLRPHSVSPESCPDITALLGFQKRLIQLCASYILKEEDSVTVRAERIALFIEVAEELHMASNWQSLYSIVACLQSPPIARLRKSWDRLVRNFPEHYSEFVTLSESAFDHVHHQPAGPEEACIPFFDEMMNTIKTRCMRRMEDVLRAKRSSRVRPWTNPNQLAAWIQDEVTEVRTRAMESQKVKASGHGLGHKAATNVHKNHGEAKSGHHLRIIERLRRNLSKSNLIGGRSGTARSHGMHESASAAVILGGSDHQNGSQKRESMGENVAHQPLGHAASLRRVASAPKDFLMTPKRGGGKGDLISCAPGGGRMSGAISPLKASNSSPTSPIAVAATIINWSAVDVQKLDPEDEKEILREMAATMEEWHTHARSYHFVEHDEKIRDFILLYPYEDMKESMKRSIRVEPAKKRSTTT